MPWLRSILLCLSVAVAGGGCAPSLPAGSAGLKVTVLAEPKAGFKPEAARAAGYDVNAEGPEDKTTRLRDPFRTLEYARLGDIAVYLVPEQIAATAPVPRPVVVDFDSSGSAPGHELMVSAVGGDLVASNLSDQAQSLYLRSEDGTVTDVGTVPAKAKVTVPLKAPGAFTLVRESTAQREDEPLAQLFVAPNGWIETGSHQQLITFSPLPPGTYTLVTWHPRLPGTSQTVTLPPNQFTTVTATVGVNGLPKVP